MAGLAYALYHSLLHSNTLFCSRLSPAAAAAPGPVGGHQAGPDGRRQDADPGVVDSDNHRRRHLDDRSCKSLDMFRITTYLAVTSFRINFTTRLSILYLASGVMV